MGTSSGPDLFVVRSAVSTVVRAKSWERPTTIVSLRVAPGAYLVTARLRVLSEGSAEKLAADCILSTGDSVHLNHLDTDRTANTERIGWPVVLHDVASFVRPTVITLSGTTVYEDGWLAEQVVLTALRVGAINPLISLVSLPFEWSQGPSGLRGIETDVLQIDRLAAESAGSGQADMGSELRRLQTALEAALDENELLRARLERDTKDPQETSDP
jgi:hypothetical protein